tara:strand:+ start:253 stop:528 length:276 start_codon:yes stop_codon:yes gene_type:complete
MNNLTKINIKKLPNDYTYDVEETLKWELSNISYILQYEHTKKTYVVYMAKLEEKILIKPYKCYGESEFEQIFGFNYNCENFDMNKIRILHI